LSKKLLKKCWWELAQTFIGRIWYLDGNKFIFLQIIHTNKSRRGTIILGSFQWNTSSSSFLARSSFEMDILSPKLNHLCLTKSEILIKITKIIPKCIKITHKKSHLNSQTWESQHKTKLNEQRENQADFRNSNITAFVG